MILGQFEGIEFFPRIPIGCAVTWIFSDVALICYGDVCYCAPGNLTCCVVMLTSLHVIQTYDEILTYFDFAVYFVDELYLMVISCVRYGEISSYCAWHDFACLYSGFVAIYLRYYLYFSISTFSS